MTKCCIIYIACLQTNENMYILQNDNNKYYIKDCCVSLKHILFIYLLEEPLNEFKPNENAKFNGGFKKKKKFKIQKFYMFCSVLFNILFVIRVRLFLNYYYMRNLIFGLVTVVVYVQHILFGLIFLHNFTFTYFFFYIPTTTKKLLLGKRVKFFKHQITYFMCIQDFMFLC